VRHGDSSVKATGTIFSSLRSAEAEIGAGYVIKINPAAQSSTPVASTTARVDSTAADVRVAKVLTFTFTPDAVN
jgi:hypothetical protein